MERFLAWWKKEDRYLVLLKAVFMGLLPLFCCMVYCAAYGKTISQVYLPGSEWNDELFYFKQVESIVHYGYPQGFFGFNESHALKLSFAAWSPVLVFPWIIWGLLFGWTLLSPIYCNIFLLCLTMVLFVCLVRPTMKQLGILTLLFCLYTPFVRYMLSGMPEVICFSMLILFYSVAIRYLRTEQGFLLFLLFVLSGVMSLMRPYLLLFLLLPAFLWIRRSGRKGVLGSVLVLGGVFGSYALIKHYLGAEYFAPLFFTDWVDAFFEKGIFGGIGYTLSKVKWMGSNFLSHTLQGFQNGLASGAFFGGYLVMLLVLLWQFIVETNSYRKQKRLTSSGEKVKLPASVILTGHMVFCFVGMLFALLLMYKLTEGSKHLLTFMAAGIFVVSLMKTRFFKKAVLIGATFAYLYSYMAVDPYDYQVPFATEECIQQINQWEKQCEQKLILTKDQVPSYDNVIIWTLNDQVDQQWVSLRWQLLYGLPEGFGISCCEQNYVVTHLETLKSRYLTVVANGRLDEKCKEAGYTVIYGDQDMVLYQRY